MHCSVPSTSALSTNSPGGEVVHEVVLDGSDVLGCIINTAAPLLRLENGAPEGLKPTVVEMLDGSVQLKEGMPDLTGQ